MPAARTHDPETSHAAARPAYKPSEVHEHIVIVMDAVDSSLTDDELYQQYVAVGLSKGWVIPTPQSLRSRRKELERSGRVRFAGSYGRTASGRQTRRWALVR